MMDDKMTPTTLADALRASAADEPENKQIVNKFSQNLLPGGPAGRKKVGQRKRPMHLQLPDDIEQYIRDNGGSGFVVGLVRSVMR